MTKSHGADFIANFWQGCTIVSDGCQTCPAMIRNERHAHGENWGPDAPRRSIKAGFEVIRKMQRAAAAGLFRQETKTGDRWIWTKKGIAAVPDWQSFAVRPKVMAMSLGDIWDPEVELEELCAALGAMLGAPMVDFMLLTKRPELARQRVNEARQYADKHGILYEVPEPNQEGLLAFVLDEWLAGKPPANIALGVTVEQQQHCDRLEDMASKLTASRYFVAIDPMLEQITIPAIWRDLCDLVIAGGGSGDKARPIAAEWIEQLQLACGIYKIDFHFRGWGDWIPDSVMACPPAMQVRGSCLWMDPDGKTHAPDTEVADDFDLVWRAGKIHDFQNTLPDGTRSTPVLQMQLDTGDPMK